MKHIISRMASVMAVAIAAVSCAYIDPAFTAFPEEGNTTGEIGRIPNSRYRKIFIVYMMGFNNLTNYLKEDAEDLINNTMMNNRRDALLIFSHRAGFKSGSPDYNTPTSPVLTHIYRSDDGETVRDTLWTMPQTWESSDAGTLNKVLTFVKERFPADSYGLLMSSHGTGWMPENYCNAPGDFDRSTSSSWNLPKREHIVPKPYMSVFPTDDGPAVKSLGVQNISRSQVKEMDIPDIAAAIPMKLDFIIFDACFMGGIEVAYEFRDVCDKMAFSQTEILADGMDYTTMNSYIFNGIRSDLEGFCDNYFQFYDRRSGSNRSATISLVDCSRLEPIAEACRDIFSSNTDGIAAIEGSSSVQKYYRSSYSQYHKWFFDLRDIILKSGASEEQMNRLDSALDECIIYKAATENFLELPIDTHCGLSMYLPYKNREYLNNFYKTLEWNKATGLVK